MSFNCQLRVFLRNSWIWGKQLICPRGVVEHCKIEDLARAAITLNNINKNIWHRVGESWTKIITGAGKTWDLNSMTNDFNCDADG